MSDQDKYKLCKSCFCIIIDDPKLDDVVFSFTKIWDYGMAITKAHIEIDNKIKRLNEGKDLSVTEQRTKEDDLRVLKNNKKEFEKLWKGIKNIKEVGECRGCKHHRENK